jgi:starch-binding outer membrane protein, SusD/RagB family
MNKILLASTLLLGMLAWTGCSEDYLDTAPTDNVGTSTVFETTANGKLAINGIAKMMTKQYLSTQGFNGEGTIKMYYGNYPGNDFFVNLSGWSAIINSDFHENITSIYCYYPWYYYYKLIGNANAVVAYIDGAAGTQSERDFIKAQALTFRAYSFFMLSQVYCKRWIDSNSGASDGLVLRTDLSTGNMALSSLAKTYEQIYADLDEAIALYNKSSEERSAFYEPDLNVAYAVYARAAITKQDYATALEMAQKARNGYPLMNNAEYKAGFSTPNQEWIWGSYGASDETLYFYSYFAYIAYNSSASAVRTYPKCISKELYEKIPSTDIRKALFLDPTGYSYTTGTGVAGADLKAKAFELYPSLYSTATVYAYMQFKVNAQDLPGVGNLNHFRSSEMYLIEAEAKYFLSDEEGARETLVQLTNASGRDPLYSTSNAGAALLSEIKTYRAIELWGEGFDWFDMKRWGDTINRKSTSNGGNFISVLAVTIAPNEKNNWVWRYPAKETEFNKALTLSE